MRLVGFILKNSSFIYYLYLSTPSRACIGSIQLERTWKESGCGPTWNITPIQSYKTAGLRAEAWTLDLKNTTQNWKPVTRNDLHAFRFRIFFDTIKSKAIPLQAWTGPEGSRSLRLPFIKKICTWRWQGCQPYAPAAFTSKETFLVLISVRDQPRGLVVRASGY